MKTLQERITKIVSEQLGVAESEATPEKTLAGNLGADSLDTVELVMSLEDEFGIEIPDTEAEKFATVGDLITYVDARQVAA